MVGLGVLPIEAKAEEGCLGFQVYLASMRNSGLLLGS